MRGVNTTRTAAAAAAGDRAVADTATAALHSCTLKRRCVFFAAVRDCWLEKVIAEGTAAAAAAVDAIVVVGEVHPIIGTALALLRRYSK